MQNNKTSLQIWKSCIGSLDHAARWRISPGTCRYVIGAVTTVGKLSLVIEYAKETFDSSTMNMIKTKALKLLFGS